ncbi:LADA_0F02190g1_1 [Lachancea dasiensis]|uniref:LADA_0F02190g1_1 n=1 Tax=Lachancea dasiensis TaxID=1072105 RepID=A0A1G4JI93_9SACH|nr:LADA_0F02190g1_1 [Lachancea dasiensis]
MSKPELPPKPNQNIPDTRNSNYPLPDNTNLLPLSTLEDLSSIYGDHLKDYVVRFEGCSDIQTGCEKLKTELQELSQEFEVLEARKEQLSSLLDDVNNLQKEHESYREELNHLISTTYGNDAMENKTEVELSMLESQATALESKNDLPIDQFIQRHVKLRQQYHVKRGLLHSWQHTD